MTYSEKIIRCNPIENRVIPVLNKKEYFERKSAHLVCESAGTLLPLSKQSSGQTLNHTKRDSHLCKNRGDDSRIRTGDYRLQKFPLSYRFSISPCVCLSGSRLTLKRKPDKTAQRVIRFIPMVAEGRT